MAQAQGQGPSTKGNPASKRMRNANLKARRARSWAKDRDPDTEKKLVHAQNERAQKLREIKNDKLRAQGMPTPWEVARIERRNRRAELRDARAGKPKRGRAA